MAEKLDNATTVMFTDADLAGWDNLAQELNISRSMAISLLLRFYLRLAPARDVYLENMARLSYLADQEGRDAVAPFDDQETLDSICQLLDVVELGINPRVAAVVYEEPFKKLRVPPLELPAGVAAAPAAAPVKSAGKGKGRKGGKA